MAYQEPVEKYNSKIREVTIGREKTVTVGGETTLPFYLFEGRGDAPSSSYSYGSLR